MSATKKAYTKEFEEKDVRLGTSDVQDGQLQQTGKRSQVARDLRIQVSMLLRWQLELEQHQERVNGFQDGSCF